MILNLISLMTLKLTEPKQNQGFITEANHYEQLTYIFGNENVSTPKNSGGGSDFIVMHKDQIITFESKTSNTDICDAGCVSLFSNGSIYTASSFLTDTNIRELESMITNNISQVIDYTSLAQTDRIPHVIDVNLYNDIKNSDKLIHITNDKPLTNIVEETFLKSKNRFVKANYIIFNDNIFCISANPVYDPLHLQSYGAPVLNVEHIDKVFIRSGRGGSRKGKASVTARVQYKFARYLPETKVKLSDIG